MSGRSLYIQVALLLASSVVCLWISCQCSRTLFVIYQDSVCKETLKDNGEPTPLNSDFRSEIHLNLNSCRLMDSLPELMRTNQVLWLQLRLIFLNCLQASTVKLSRPLAPRKPSSIATVKTFLCPCLPASHLYWLTVTLRSSQIFSFWGDIWKIPPSMVGDSSFC
ncbi:hypothetical protein Ddye_031362 [Dipteronia dyeriana]|uniref:ATP synthase F0 subunit 8 n=1 Tax=Dipteronia dyeriana TaxID=168575 RepID=A0AAD9WNM7_9ROSI|nr:hypothetical protein Ddye_031362 [Dipteronia dyeriana]